MSRRRPAGSDGRGGRAPGARSAPTSRARGAPERLRSLNEPRSVRVRTDARGRPRAVGGPGSRVRVVASIRESWRIDDEWWRRPVSRLYHDVILENGQLLTLYRDRIEGAWYVHG